MRKKKKVYRHVSERPEPFILLTSNKASTVLVLLQLPLLPLRMLALVRSSIRNHYNTRVHSRVRVTTRTSTRLAFTPSPQNDSSPQRPEHAVISTFDLFSIGVGPSSSHTVGPMRAGKIFITDLEELNLLSQIRTLKVTL
ncbi:hypothetical protein H2248_010565 [Termitomyces sp. 'cryptogamus']|nr:hypothetical protein H2248_010565 [Termitomyces sp. 'cryptogamus']